MFPTKNIPSKYAESIKFDAKRLGKKLCRRPELQIIAIFKQKKEIENLTFFSETSFFISLMNTKCGIFIRGFATRENTAFVVHSVK